MTTGRDDIVEALEQLIEAFENGTLESAALRVQYADGTWEDIVIGFDTDEERDAVLAKLRGMLVQLH
jgi:hypothetical protein